MQDEGRERRVALGGPQARERERRALPRWIGGLALGGAVVNLIAAPSIYGGTDYTASYSASGWITYIAQLTWVAWFAIASVSMIRRREQCKAPSLARAV